MIASVAATIAGCSSWVKVAEDSDTEILIWPESVKPHSSGRVSDWEARLTLNFKRPRPGETQTDAQSRSALVDVVFHCVTAPRVSLTRKLAIGFQFTNLVGQWTFESRAGRPSRLDSAPILAKVYEEVCNRPEARQTIARALEEDESKRAAHLAQMRAVQAEQERRERIRAEANEQRIRAQATAESANRAVNPRRTPSPAGS